MNERHHRMPDGALVICDGTREGSELGSAGRCPKAPRCANYKVRKCFIKCADFTEKQTANLVY
ncbi:MAG: hypothetical protein ABSF44_10535 [Candidatus Bathyarchaeia archaeon]